MRKSCIELSKSTPIGQGESRPGLTISALAIKVASYLDKGATAERIGGRSPGELPILTITETRRDR